MIGSIIGGVVAVTGLVATSGAAASVARGFVRGFGRLVEGHVLAGLNEIKDGIEQPIAVALVQGVNLLVDTVNVVAYTGLQVIGSFSNDTKDLLSKINGFENTIAAVVIAVSMPDTSVPPSASANADARIVAGREAALLAGESEFWVDGVRYSVDGAAAA